MGTPKRPAFLVVAAVQFFYAGSLIDEIQANSFFMQANCNLNSNHYVFSEPQPIIHKYQKY
jgi:hypothetical protein